MENIALFAMGFIVMGYLLYKKANPDKPIGKIEIVIVALILIATWILPVDQTYRPHRKIERWLMR